MSVDSELHYLCKPLEPLPSPSVPIDFMSVTEFLADEPSCKVLWDLVSNQFRTRSKFLSVWSCVSYVAVHRDDAGQADGLLLVSTPINWQIDYVVVKPEARGRGIASALVKATLNQAYLHKVPYVMLTSKESLRPLYESCGFSVVASAVTV